MNKKLFIFDFDGTLVNTSQDILNAINFTRHHYQLKPLSFAQAKVYIGVGQASLVQDITKDNPAVNQEEARKLFREYYQEHIRDNARFYPGVANTLTSLQQANKKLAIISNKFSFYITDILKGLNCPVQFDLIIGADSLPERKPAPAPIHHACKTLKIDEADTVIIGDSIHDIRAGKAAGITTIAVMYGFGERTTLEQEKPDLIIDSFSRLL